MSNSLGKLFRVTSFGESHGRLVGAVIDGCPAGLELSEADIQPDLDRRRPGGGAVSTPRTEEDQADILSGVFNGKTTGAPICITIPNRNAQSDDYAEQRSIPRPSHADYTYYVKYGGHADYRGGGRASGRLTASMVMAGAIARKLLTAQGIEILGHAVEIGGIKTSARDYDTIRRDARFNATGCADQDAAKLMLQAIDRARRDGDSLGGIIEVIALGVPAGLGEPLFDSAESAMAQAFFSIPAVKGVEFGAGFAAARLKGSENNDPFIISEGRVQTDSNHAGGILGGITSGMPITARLAVKPTPSIALPQRSVNLESLSAAEMSVRGRHDPCVVPRAIVVAEAAMAITLCDLSIIAGTMGRVMA
ncbi:MAG: chorismate synthase [Dehalococcoidia bacterium]|nr:chorismate synthase [Dehalococcoidia bacterium]